MIIDIHTHTYPDEIASRAISKLAKSTDIFNYTNGTQSALLGSQACAGIDLSVLLPVVTKPSQTHTINTIAHSINEQTSRLHLYSFAGIHPDDPDPDGTLDQIVQSSFKGIKLKSEDKSAVSIGLLPNSLQLVENNFTQGLTEIAISDRPDMVEMTYREGTVENRFVVGIEKPNITVLTFGNQRYNVAVKGRFATNEEDMPVFTVQIDFLETPFRRMLKLVLDGDRATLFQDETPGKNYILNVMNEVIDNRTGITVLSNAVDKELLDVDYVEYKVEKTFSPKIELKVQ